MMEENKNIFTYIKQVFTVFGIIVLVFVALNLIIGEKTAGYSSLFALGKDGISIAVLCELLLLSVVITAAQVIFLTDRYIANMSMLIRNMLFFVTVMIVMVIMIFIFDWFPVRDAAAWTGFIISYALSMGLSALVTKSIEKIENSKMQKALDKYNGIK